MPKNNDPMSSWMKPENASVMDSMATRLARRIYAAIQGGAQGELGVAAMGATQPMRKESAASPLMSAIRKRLGDRANDLINNLGDFGMSEKGDRFIYRGVTDAARSTGKGGERVVSDAAVKRFLHSPDALGVDPELNALVGEARSAVPATPGRPVASGSPVASAPASGLPIQVQSPSGFVVEFKTLDEAQRYAAGRAGFKVVRF